MSTISWDVMPCGLVEAYRCFGGTYCLHLEGQRVRNLFATSFLLVTLLANSSTETSVNLGYIAPLP
jgi:hypothetical protein